MRSNLEIAAELKALRREVTTYVKPSDTASLHGRYLVSKKKKSVAHIWTGNDTACRMYSTGGMSKFKKSVSDNTHGKPICTMCQSAVQNNSIAKHRIQA
jgi:hypothetical protein